MVLVAKKLRQPLNYILISVSLGGFLFCIFSVATVFITSCRGYFTFGHRMCALEDFLGSTAGTTGEGATRSQGWNRGQAAGLECNPKEESGGV